MARPTVVLRTASELWYRDILTNHADGANDRVKDLLAGTTRDINGCLVTNTKQPRKTRFRGQQDRAYRFVYYIVNCRAPYEEEVVRHLCHNRLCINPAHLTTGERGDNRHDDRLQEAYGIDYNWLVG